MLLLGICPTSAGCAGSSPGRAETTLIPRGGRAPGGLGGFGAAEDPPSEAVGLLAYSRIAPAAKVCSISAGCGGSSPRPAETTSIPQGGRALGGPEWLRGG